MPGWAGWLSRGGAWACPRAPKWLSSRMRSYWLCSVLVPSRAVCVLVCECGGASAIYWSFRAPVTMPVERWNPAQPMYSRRHNPGRLGQAPGGIQTRRNLPGTFYRWVCSTCNSPLVGSVCQQRHNSNHRSFGWTGHVASGVQLAPRHDLSNCWQAARMPGKYLEGCSWPQDMSIQHELLAGSCTGSNGSGRAR